MTMRCPIPENEADRLAAVRSYDILDSPPEVEFDALTRLASHTFGTPAAVVGMMDSDRLWFKSRLGLEVPQLDRQIAFCAYAVMQPGKLLIVEDLQQDARFSENPLVLNAPHIRFYAGAPLVDHNGFALGTIAIVDTHPRSLDSKEQAILHDLAILAMTALENRRHSVNLSKLAMTDHLTGLANRAQFDRTLEAEIAHAKRSGEPFTLLCMDLDGFKLINDKFGHPAGDEVLCEVARRLQELVRADELVSRFGGDEFGVVMRNASLSSTQALIERISNATPAPITLFGGDKVSVGISIGTAVCTGNDTLATLLARGDAALYQAKRASGKKG